MGRLEAIEKHWKENTATHGEREDVKYLIARLREATLLLESYQCQDLDSSLDKDVRDFIAKLEASDA